MNDEKTEDKLHSSTRGGSPWVLLDKHYSVSDKPEAYDTVYQQSSDCTEVQHGLNGLKFGWAGIAFSG